MTRIHIVEPYHSAAMIRMISPFEELKALHEVTTGTEPDEAADVNIHMPWHSMTGYERTGSSKHIIAYTHCNPGADNDLRDACERADIVTAMSWTGRRELVGMGVDPKKIHVIYCGANQIPFRRRMIAIVGYPQPNGRKRESLLFDLAYQYDLKHYEFLFVGIKWEDTVARLKSLGVACGTTGGIEDDVLREVYARADVVLSTGYIEGGPLPLLEAMAAGCKVFSPRFGYAADLLTDDEIYDTPDELMEKLDGHFGKCIENTYLAHGWSWLDYAAEYALIIGRMLGTSVDLYPKRGLSRYAQLLDIIDECKPTSIVEVGTWVGNTAIRMIQQAAKYHRMEQLFYQGFDLFEGQTAADFRAELSKGSWPQALVQRRLSATGAGVMLVKGYTRDTMPEHLKADADLFFIDGGHSEETIENDGQLVYSMKDTAVAVFDDYYTPARDGAGCNKFISSLPREEFEIHMLPAVTQSEGIHDLGSISMVKVTRRKDAVRLPMSTSTYAYAGS